MSPTYASGTEMSSEKSRMEIERTLRRYHATGFVYGWTPERALVGFHVADRQVRFELPMPDINDPQFTHTPAKGWRRSPEAQREAYEQAVRQRWRALALVIKAKLEAVEAGIVTFDAEFLAHLVLPRWVDRRRGDGPAAAVDHGRRRTARPAPGELEVKARDVWLLPVAAGVATAIVVGGLVLLAADSVIRAVAWAVRPS